MNVLLTGGAGYIGSHTAVECLASGNAVVVFDNLSNSSPKSLERVAQIAGKSATFVQGDIRDRVALRKLFSDHCIDSVVHFAGLKAVGDRWNNRCCITTTTSRAAWCCSRKWLLPA